MFLINVVKFGIIAKPFIPEQPGDYQYWPQFFCIMCPITLMFLFMLGLPALLRNGQELLYGGAKVISVVALAALGLHLMNFWYYLKLNHFNVDKMLKDLSEPPYYIAFTAFYVGWFIVDYTLERRRKGGGFWSGVLKFFKFIIIVLVTIVTISFM